MSADAFAALRKNAGDDIAKLAEEHFKHDLFESDRDTLKIASNKIATHASVGSVLGLGLGLLLAFRLRGNRNKAFNALRGVDKPVGVRFADGREEAMPNLTSFLKPTTFGDVATHFLLGTGGLFIGVEIGVLTGSGSVGRIIGKDPEGKARIEKAFRKFRADVLRKEADELDGGKGVSAVLGF